MSEVKFSGLGEQGLLDDRRELHENLVQVIRQVRPQRVDTWSLEWDWKSFGCCHPVHLATGAAALTAIYPDVRSPFALAYPREEEGLEPWAVQQVRLISSRAGKSTTTWTSLGHPAATSPP